MHRHWDAVRAGEITRGKPGRKKGCVFSREHRASLSKAQKGHTVSKATRRSISEGMRRYHAERRAREAAAAKEGTVSVSEQKTTEEKDAV